MDEKLLIEDDPAVQSLIDNAVAGEPDDDAILKALLQSVKQGRPSTFEALLERFGTSALARVAEPPAFDERNSVVRNADSQKEQACKTTADYVKERDLLEAAAAVLKLIFGDADKLEFCKVLVEHGWDLNKRIRKSKYQDWTPLSLALKCPETVRWLLDHGADPNMRAFTDSRIDFLAYAAASSPPEVVKLLIDRGARVQDTLALHTAAGASRKYPDDLSDDEPKPDPSRVEVLNILLDAGANVNQMEPDPKWERIWGHGTMSQRTSWTGTPLHHAIRSGSAEAVSCLLARGADLLHPSWSGVTAIRAAECYERRQDILDAIALHEKQREA